MVAVLEFILVLISLPYWISAITVFTHIRLGHVNEKNLPKVSVVIPTKNEENVIESTLKKIKESDYPKNKLEIIVVDANSSDNTVKIARKYTRNIIVEKYPKGKPHALNLALKKSRGEIFYIIDADSWVEKNTIKDMMLHMDDHQAISGISLPRNKNNIIARVARLENTLFLDVVLFVYRLLGTSIASGKNYAVHKNTLKKIGGFNDVLTEDINISFRLYHAGHKIKLVPLKCYEQVPDKLSWYLKQQKRWSIGGINEMANAFKKMPLLWIVLVPALALLALTSVAFTLSLIGYLISQNPMFLLVTIPSFISFLTIIRKYLKKDDLYYLPITIFLLGFFQIIMNVYAFVEVVAGKKIKWERTPKEKQ